MILPTNLHTYQIIYTYQTIVTGKKKKLTKSSKKYLKKKIKNQDRSISAPTLCILKRKMVEWLKW
jgi:hypothetical protein